jgi:quinol-cytochrome oxidoreductase complex cytochrome b subunit
MSILITSRYTYYLVEILSGDIKATEDGPIIWETLIPSYVTELVFSVMVVYHIYSANKFKQSNALGIKNDDKDKKDLSWIAFDKHLLLDGLLYSTEPFYDLEEGTRMSTPFVESEFHS